MKISPASTSNRLYRPWAVSLGLLLAAIYLFGACSSTTGERIDHRFGECLESGLAAQVINPDAPVDPSPADSLPGDLGVQIYNKRYIKSMTEEKDEEDDVSSELGGMN